MDSEVKLSKKLLFLIPIIYFISPIDIIPDYFFPVAGWLDDAGVVVLMFSILKQILSKYNPLDSSNGENKEEINKDEDTVDIDDDDYEFK